MKVYWQAIGMIRHEIHAGRSATPRHENDLFGQLGQLSDHVAQGLLQAQDCVELGRLMVGVRPSKLTPAARPADERPRPLSPGLLGSPGSMADGMISYQLNPLRTCRAAVIILEPERRRRRHPLPSQRMSQVLLSDSVRKLLEHTGQSIELRPL